MQIYGPSQVHGPQGIQGPHFNRSNSQTQTAGSTQSVGDQLDISAAAEAAIEATESQDIRTDRITRIRNEIAAGTYDSTERMAAAMEGLLDEIR